MKQETILWINNLENLIQQKHMLFHPFYQAWTAGTLTRSTLQMYAKEYYQHVKAFPTYISALHSRCEDPKIRRQLLTNLMDEEDAVLDSSETVLNTFWNFLSSFVYQTTM